MAAVLTLEQIVAEISISRQEITAWIEQRWILPVEQDGDYLFDEADQARVRLIAELRQDLEVNDEAMPVILQLLDQVYTLRRTLADLQDAIERLPEEARAELDALLREALKD